MLVSEAIISTKVTSEPHSVRIFQGMTIRCGQCSLDELSTDLRCINPLLADACQNIGSPIKNAVRAWGE